MVMSGISPIEELCAEVSQCMLGSMKQIVNSDALRYQELFILTNQTAYEVEKYVRSGRISSTGRAKIWIGSAKTSDSRLKNLRYINYIRCTGSSLQHAIFLVHCACPSDETICFGLIASRRHYGIDHIHPR